MVAEAAPEVVTPVVPEGQPNPSPPEAPSFEPPSQDAPPEQEPQADPVSAPEPTEDDLLRSYAEKTRKFHAGESETLGVTRAESDAFSVWQQREQQQEANRKAAQERYEAYVGQLESLYDTGRKTVADRLDTMLHKMGIEPDEDARELLERDLQAAFGDLKANAEEVVFQPRLRLERSKLAATLVQHLGWPERRAADYAGSLGLTAQGDLPAIDEALYWAGIEYGRKQGPEKDSVVLSKAEYDKAIADAEKRGEDGVKVRGPAPPSGGRPAPAPNTITYNDVLKNPALLSQVDSLTDLIEKEYGKV